MPARSRKSLAASAVHAAKKSKVERAEQELAASALANIGGSSEAPGPSAAEAYIDASRYIDASACEDPLVEMRKPSEKFAKELLGLGVTVPGSVFGNEHAAAEEYTGMLIKYSKRSFTVGFAAQLDLPDLVDLTWAHVFGDETYKGAYLSLEQQRWTADMLTPAPPGRPPTGAACWDMRRAEYVQRQLGDRGAQADAGRRS